MAGLATHHAGRRLRFAAERGADRNRLGRRLLLRGGAQEPAPVGRRARRVGVHGVGGFIGIVLLGVFATKAYNPAGADGLLAGNPTFFVRQCVAVAGLVGVGVRRSRSGCCG